MTTEKKQGRIVGAVKSVTNYEQVKETGQWIGSMISALDPRRIKAGRVETFDQARTRLGVNNEEIEQVRVNQVHIFWGVFTMMLCGWAVFAGQPFSLTALVLILSYSVMCLSMMFRASFRASQIKARTLHSIKTWASNRGYWLPWF